MGRPKKKVIKINPLIDSDAPSYLMEADRLGVSKYVETEDESITDKLPIYPLTLDYPHEYLNDMGKKVNELVEAYNALQK